MKSTDPIMSWQASDAYNRSQQCRAFLKQHGFLSDTENAEVIRRLHKWVAAESGILYWTAAEAAMH